MGNSPLSRDAAIAEIAARQHGLITLAQAASIGVSSDSLRRRVNAGVLARVCPNVFRLTSTPRSWQQRAMAASLWVGSNGAVGGDAAAALHRLDGFGPPVEIEVITPRSINAPQRWVKVCRTPYWGDEDSVINAGIRVTSVERTLVSIAAVSSAERLEIAVEDALRRRLTTCDRISKRLAGLPVNQSGRRRLQDLLVARGTAPPAESGLEVKVIRLLREEGYPRPIRQKVLDDDGRFVGRVDLVFPDRRLIIEADGYEFHRDRAAWDTDRERRNALTALGWVVLHATSTLVREREDFLRDIKRAYWRPL